MYQIIASIALITSFASYFIYEAFKEADAERKIINNAKAITQQSEGIGKIINIEDSFHNSVNSNITNSILMDSKPITYKISHISGGNFEADIINKYSDAVTKVMNDNPNRDIDCVVLASTNIITQSECEEVHEKEYSFYHRKNDGSLSYSITDEKVMKYATSMEENKYNKNITKENNTISLNNIYIENNNALYKNQSDLKFEETINNIKFSLENKNYLNAATNLYMLKKNDYSNKQIIPFYYNKLFESLDDTVDENTKIKIQYEFAKLTTQSNISEIMNISSESEIFFNKLVENYSSLQQLDKNLKKNELPSKNDLMLAISKMKKL